MLVHESVKIPYPHLVNMYGCCVDEGCFIGPFVEIQNNVNIHKNVRISSHSFICSGVTIGENTFIAHGVMFVNDKFDSPDIKSWSQKNTFIGKNVRIGSNSTILPVTIGDDVIIGAGSVVTRDIPSNTTVCGNPAREIKNE